MPWSIQKGAGRCGPDQFAVVKKGDGKVEGCHPSRPAAEKQMAALYASEKAVADAAWREMARTFTAEQRQQLAKSGKALSDGSFPIVNVADLKNAIQAIGRAKNPTAAKRHVCKRAKALGASNLVPEGWCS